MDDRRVRAALWFFGEPDEARLPAVGEVVELRVADGSWRSGFRVTSTPEDGHVWVCGEDEYQKALSEARQPVGDTWPLAAMRPVDEDVESST